MISITRTEGTETCGQCGETFPFGAQHRCAPIDASTPERARSVIRNVLRGSFTDRDIDGLARAIRTLADQPENENA